jgi:hypothetical protein
MAGLFFPLKPTIDDHIFALLASQMRRLHSSCVTSTICSSEIRQNEPLCSPGFLSSLSFEGRTNRTMAPTSKIAQRVGSEKLILPKAIVKP